MKKAWWKEEIVYQIYPRSFNDSNADGIGDLNGIREKLDYLRDLGVTCLWLSPIYKSPMDDMGYDISDYRDINEEFGTLEEFKLLLAKAHEHGIKLLMDLVVNHTSDEHPWFMESRKSKDNPYRDYYIWRDGKEGGPPSDWRSFFYGPAWEYDKATDQYYLHLFSKKQPDLNWENPKVRAEIYDMMRFWCELGIDGFRIDTVLMYSKNMDFPDTGEPERIATEYFEDGPRMHEFLKEMHAQVFSRYNVMTVGEAGLLPPERIAPYVREAENELNMAIHFEHFLINRAVDHWATERPRPLDFKKVLSKWQRELPALGGWNVLSFSNHDQPRQVSVFGDDGEFWEKSAKMLATLLLTQQGTPFLYQGEELGMTNCPFEEKDFRDVETVNFLAQRRKNGEDIADCMPGLLKNSRDNARTPMQWSPGANAGFTEGEPWINVNPNYTLINAETELADKDSVLSYYRSMIALRKSHQTLVYGDFKEYCAENEALYIYSREYDGEKLLVMLNLTSSSADYEGAEVFGGKLLLSNYGDAPGKTLRPYEAALIDITEQ